MKSLNFHSTLFDCKLSKSFQIFFISENIKKKIYLSEKYCGDTIPAIF